MVGFILWLLKSMEENTEIDMFAGAKPPQTYRFRLLFLQG